MHIQVRLFALAREKAGAAEVGLSIADDATVADLWSALVGRWPQLDALGSSVSFAVNQEYAVRSRVLRNDDEVAVIPPVSGG